jgi:hypothetical protein
MRPGSVTSPGGAAEEEEAVGDGGEVADAVSVEVDEAEFVLGGGIEGEAHDGQVVIAEDGAAESDGDDAVGDGDALDIDAVFLAWDGAEASEDGIAAEDGVQVDALDGGGYPACGGINLEAKDAVPAVLELELLDAPAVPCGGLFVGFEPFAFEGVGSGGVHPVVVEGEPLEIDFDIAGQEGDEGFAGR